MTADGRRNRDTDHYYDSDLPLIVSLEVHAGAEQQEIMVEIMKSVWRDFLIPLPVPDPATLPNPASLRNKILVKVKYSNPKNAAEKLQAGKDVVASDLRPESRDGSSSSENGEVQVADTPKKKKKKSAIVPSLSALGIYTQAYHFKSLTAPEATVPTHVFSLSEKKLMEVHGSSGPTLFSHNRDYLMRAFPSGMRVRSDNLDPSVFWRKGVQMVALNWQRWDEGMMLNEGMFCGSGGYVLKPKGYLSKPTTSTTPQLLKESQADAVAHRTLTLLIEILAAQNIPLPLGDSRPSGFHPYVKCELHVETPAERTGQPIERGGKAKEGEYKWKSRTMKGVEVDFGAEKVEFKEIPGVVEELSFLRYMHFSFSRTSHASWSLWWKKRDVHTRRIACVRAFRCSRLKGRILRLDLAMSTYHFSFFSGYIGVGHGGGRRSYDISSQLIHLLRHPKFKPDSLWKLIRRIYRFKIQDDKIGQDDLAAWACIRLDRLRDGYRFVHLLDGAGFESKGVLLVYIQKTLT